MRVIDHRKNSLTIFPVRFDAVIQPSHEERHQEDSTHADTDRQREGQSGSRPWHASTVVAGRESARLMVEEPACGTGRVRSAVARTMMGG